MHSAKMNKKGLWALAAVVVIAGGYYFLSATPDDQALSALATPQGTALATVTLPATLSANAQIGETAFNAKCMTCHGPNAEGQKGVAPPLVHKIYEPSHHGDMAFVLAAQNGVRSHHWPFGDMASVEGLTKADVLNIVAYVRELQRENGIN